MTARDFLTNVAVILTVMAGGALLETLVPMFAARPWTQRRRMANLGLTALSFGSNWLLASLAALAALTLRPAGLLAQLGWPLWIEIVFSIVVLDFSVGYLSHRTMHMWPAMWRFHQIHHSDPFVDVTTTYRTHPVETVWRFLFAIVPVWLLGIPAQAVVIQRLLQATNGVIEHAKEPDMKTTAMIVGALLAAGAAETVNFDTLCAASISPLRIGARTSTPRVLSSCAHSTMDLELDGRRVLVTGGSKGIGLACARAFLAEGARVAIASRSEANLAAARDELGPVITVAADLADAGAARAMVERVESELGAIDILVTSAGAARRTAPDDLNPDAWRAAMDAKYFTYINAIDPVVKLMAARGRGVIVNIIGNGGKVASPIHLPGGAANAALMLATVGLANAYAAKGVRILGINPGLTKTSRVVEGMQAEAARHGITEAEALKRSIDRIPLGRLAEAEEVAAVAVFAASPRASYLTGAIITMDGASSPVVV